MNVYKVEGSGFPVTIVFNDGQQHLTVDGAKELTIKLADVLGHPIVPMANLHHALSALTEKPSAEAVHAYLHDPAVRALADTIKHVIEETAAQLPALLDALGWQGGTVADALAEVRRLRGQVRDVYVYLDGIDMANPMEGHFQALHNIVRPIGAPVPQPVIGQGVAALLPEHGEVKRGRRCKRDGKYLIAGSLNQVPYDGQGEPMLFSDEQCVSLDRLGYDVELYHGAWS